MAQKGGLPRFVPNKPCAERASACQARACTGAEGLIHSEESVVMSPESDPLYFADRPARYGLRHDGGDVDKIDVCAAVHGL